MEASLNDVKRLLLDSGRDAEVPNDINLDIREVGEAADHRTTQGSEQADKDSKDIQIAPVITVRDFAASIDGPFIVETSDLVNDLEPIQDALEFLEDELLNMYHGSLALYISVTSNKIADFGRSLHVTRSQIR